MPKVIRATITNILGIKHAELHPNGKSVVIGGRNRQGKSSAQRALLLAIDAAANMPAEPVHRGAEQGEVALELDNGMKVHRVVKADGKTTLTLRQADNPGVRFDQPAKTLKALFGELAFDPGEFNRAKPADRRAICLQLAGINTTQLDVDEEKAREHRTTAGRERKRLEGELSGKPWHSDAPAEEIAQATVLAELEAANNEIAKHRTLVNLRDTKIERLAAIKKRFAAIVQMIAELQRERENLNIEEIGLIEARDEAQSAINSYIAPDLMAIKAKSASIEETNRKVRANREHLVVKDKLAQAVDAHEKLEARVSGIQKQRVDLLASAKLPIEGLTVDAECVRYNGTPYDDCSESEQSEIDAAIACALNPNGVVCMLESGGKDWDAIKRTVEVYEAAGVQAFIEVVNDDPDVVDIVFEQGAVKVDRTAETVAA